MKVPTETMEMNISGKPYLFTVRATEFRVSDFNVLTIGRVGWSGPCDFDSVMDEIVSDNEIREQVLIRLNARSENARDDK